MEPSNHTTPWIFSLMWMMSHPWSLVKQFIHSTSEIFLIQMVSKSWIDSGAVQTQFLKSSISADEDGVPSWSQHQKCKRRRQIIMFTLLCLLFYLVPQEILVMAPEMQEEEVNYNVYSSMFTLLSGATKDPGHGTRNASGVLIFWW